VGDETSGAQVAGLPASSAPVALTGTEEEPQQFGRLKPVTTKNAWIAGGLILQLIGVGGSVAYVVVKARHENVGGSITGATVRLAWRDILHSKTGLAIMIAGAVVFAIGAILLARPYAKSWPMLLVVVPLAAIVGMLILGAAVLVVSLIIALAWMTDGDAFTGWGGGGSSSRKKKDGDGDGAATAS